MGALIVGKHERIIHQDLISPHRLQNSDCNTGSTQLYITVQGLIKQSARVCVVFFFSHNDCYLQLYSPSHLHHKASVHRLCLGRMYFPVLYSNVYIFKRKNFISLK